MKTLALFSVTILASLVFAGCSSNSSDTEVSEASLERPDDYVDYASEEQVSSTSGDKLLFFHAPWCSQCQAMEKDILTNGLPRGVTVFKVDYDSYQDLRQKYGVTLQTTFVKVDDQGEKIASYNPFESPEFSNVQAELLN